MSCPIVKHLRQVTYWVCLVVVWPKSQKVFVGWQNALFAAISSHASTHTHSLSPPTSLSFSPYLPLSLPISLSLSLPLPTSLSLSLPLSPPTSLSLSPHSSTAFLTPKNRSCQRRKIFKFHYPYLTPIIVYTTQHITHTATLHYTDYDMISCCSRTSVKLALAALLGRLWTKKEGTRMFCKQMLYLSHFEPVTLQKCLKTGFLL